MKTIFEVSCLSDLETLMEKGHRDFIVGHPVLSIENAWEQSEYEELLEKYSYLNCEINCDGLVPEIKMDSALKALSDIPQKFIPRVRDLGLSWYLKKKKRQFSLIVDHGNHNLTGLRSYVESFKNSLVKLVLSSQLPLKWHLNFGKKLKIQKEILGIGKILLYQSPRKLLSRYGADTVKVDSEESAHKNYVFEENHLGTKMYLPKDLSILRFTKELDQIENLWLRIDLKKKSNIVLNLPPRKKPFEFLLNNWPNPTIPGFLKTNKTDALFSKIKNPYLCQDSNELMGEVLHFVKDEYTIVRLGNCLELKKGSFLFYTPDGKEKRRTIESITKISEGLVKVNYLKGLGRKSWVKVSKT